MSPVHVRTKSHCTICIYSPTHILHPSCVLLYFYCDPKGLYMKWNASVNLCNSADSRPKLQLKRNSSGCHGFCVVTLCHTYVGLQVQLIPDQQRAVISARKWFKAMKLAVAEGGMGLISHSTSDSEQECLILQVDWDTQWSHMSTADPAGLPKVVMVKSGVCMCVCGGGRAYDDTVQREKNPSQALGILIQLLESILLPLWVYVCVNVCVYVCVHPQFRFTLYPLGLYSMNSDHCIIVVILIKFAQANGDRRWV